jgi:lipoprotein-anchoring transpeptidase ErfK/SrfK
MVRVSALLAASAVLAIAPPAMAQELSPWGGWNDYGSGWQGTRPKRRGGGGYFSPYSYTPPNYRARPEPEEEDDYYRPYERPAFPALMDGGPRPVIEPEAPPLVAFANTEPAGTILIDTEARRLYFTVNAKQAFEYPISVGREGFTWTGAEQISRVAEWPDWHPPKEMRERDPKLPEKMTGGIRNPLGAMAIYLGNTLYRIHGTNDPKTIGQAASSGCFRMMNQHVVHLASLASVGTTVKVLPRVVGSNAVTRGALQPLPSGLGGSKPRI